MPKFILPVLAFVGLGVVAVSYLAFAEKAGEPTSAPVAPQNAPAAAEAAPKNITTTPDTTHKIESSLITRAPLMTDFTMGKKDAPVVIVEYASLSCPHCAHFDQEVFPQIKTKYIDTGKVLYTLRQFPLNNSAMTAAMLVHCMGEESADKYYTFVHVLFEAQKQWAFDTNYVSNLKTIAAVGGVDGSKFDSCLNRDRETEILKTKKAATDELKVPHTPYFYIDGYAHGGPKGFQAISRVIEARLAEKKNTAKR